MKILITNDDGITSPVLPSLARWAQKLGEVTVVAPKHEQSGKSQAIDFRNPVEIKRVPFDADCEAWAVDSTPADCVRFARNGLRTQYDLVISGINKGFNLGHDIVYSGTVGAIFEAMRIGIKAIAISTDIDCFDNAMREMDAIWSFITDKKLFDHAALLNVNIPGEASRGIRITRQGGMFYTDDYQALGNDLYVQVGEPYRDGSTDLSVDITAIHNGYVSISPLTADRTDPVAYEKIKNL